MAALHSALASLAPETFSTIPTSPQDLDQYISDLFTKSETILESIPQPPQPDEKTSRARSNTTASIATNASEISLSSARSAPPSPEHQALQKEWGKPIKLSQKENPLGMSVYKTSGKDGRGAWFARRSVHEGLGFTRFKSALESEFPESTAVQGAPGEGNIRGIGGERRVENVTIDGKGKMEVYHLSAQFPGPTTPRDFVTLLITSTNAMHGPAYSDSKKDLGPRHYMIISKPCIHDECPPRDGFIRGQYESVEFIREVPRQPPSEERLAKSSDDLGRIAMIRSSEQKSQTFPFHHENKSADDVGKHRHGHLAPEKPFSDNEEDTQSRKRGQTVSFSKRPNADDSEYNPVEWIMVTRSDPGGSVPRFMVERGTPGSICGDAVKFFNWATQKDRDEIEEEIRGQRPDALHHQDSFQSWQANGHMAGVNDTEHLDKQTSDAIPEENLGSSGILASVAGAVSYGIENYAPQAVLNYIPGHSHQASHSTIGSTADLQSQKIPDDDDGLSSISSVSFASAESHVSSSTPSTSSKSQRKEEERERHEQQHEKDLQKLMAKKEALDKKLAASREKALKDAENKSAREAEAIRKAEERHAKEMAKHDEKYRKELARLSAKKEKELKKMEERKKKIEEKDLKKELDGLRKEVGQLKKEKEVMIGQVGELQKENTRLAARLGLVEKLTQGSDTSVASVATGDTPAAGSGSVPTSPNHVSRDTIKQLLDEEKSSKSRLRGISMGSSGSGLDRARDRSISDSVRSKDKGDIASP